MTFHQTTFLGQDLALFLPSVDWRTAVRIAHAMETEIEAGLSDRENRRPTHEAMRLTATASFTLATAEAEALQAALWTFGSRLVGVPLWPDRLLPARWAERIYDAEFVVNYDATGYAIHARSAVSAEPAHTWLAPLLVGRLAERPQLTPINDRTATLTLTVREDSPWGFRIAPVATVVGEDWPASLAADWATPPRDWTQDLIELEAVGAGRVSAVDGQEGATRRGQELGYTLPDRAAVRTLLAFWAARAGRVQPFQMPWAFRPGADAAATPHSTLARFASDSIDLTFITDAAAQTTLRFLQVPAEIAPIAGEAPVQAAEAYLYRFRIDVDGGAVSWRYTDWERDLVRVENAEPVTYVAAQIDHNAITQALDLGDDATTIGAWMWTGNPLLRVLQRTLDVPLHVEILRCDPADPAGAVIVYVGEVAQVEESGRKLTAPTTVLGGLLDVKVPGFYFSHLCQHEFCGPGCTLAPAAWTFAGTMAGQVGAELTVLVTDNPPAAALVNGYFNRAWIKKGAGEDFELRQVIRSEDLGGGYQKFVLKRPLRSPTLGAALTFRPYCGGTRAECQTKFDNYINFGGHPHIGPRNLSVPQREASTAGGKK